MLGMGINDQKEVVVTYETLYDAVRSEKSRDEMQPLPKEFLTDVLSYLREKHHSFDETSSKIDLFSSAEHEKLGVQLNNIRRLLKELYDRREKKVVDIAINKSRTQSNMIDTSNMLEYEKVIYRQLTGVFDTFRGDVLLKLFELKEPVIEQTALEQKSTVPSAAELERKTKLVRFTQAIEQFVGKELELYGPFEANEQADLPSDIADVLISKGNALEAEEE